MINVKINGEDRRLNEGISLSALLESLQIQPARVACEVNMTVIRRSDLGGKILLDGDVVEIVQMIGGG